MYGRDGFNTTMTGWLERWMYVLCLVRSNALDDARELSRLCILLSNFFLSSGLDF
jgi:hypothetical protein